MDTLFLIGVSFLTSTFFTQQPVFSAFFTEEPTMFVGGDAAALHVPSAWTGFVSSQALWQWQDAEYQW